MPTSSEAVSLTYEIAKDAIELSRTWSIWLAGLNTSILAAVAVIAKGPCVSSTASKSWLIATVVCTAGSLFAANLTLSALPYLITHLAKRSSSDNDIWEISVYRYPFALRFKIFLHLQSWLWAFAVAGFAGFVICSST